MHGVELFAAARKNKVSISFEASCGGGIPIIRAIYDGLIANKQDALYGIVNGTCNYILTEMTLNGVSYKKALKEAQEKGLAEADPTLDVSGMDSAHKLAILSSITFGMQIDVNSIPVSGNDKLDLLDINSGKELGYIIKLIAMARLVDGKLAIRVAPSFIRKEHPLAWVTGSFNAISLYSHALGHSMYYGRGAGGSPTASAVVSDIISVFLGTAEKTFSTLPIWPDKTKPAPLLPDGEGKGRYYLRINAKDCAGVLSKIASVFAENDISISSVLQKELVEETAGEQITGAYVPVIIITHKVKEENMRRAITKIDAFDFVKSKIVYIHIMDEHEEIF
jgi:homoserine dehydrogenase